MELHHKLRRDPNWHPSGCNICGQLGHQAVNCTNGTINWRQIYGDEAFKLKPAIFPSDVDRAKKEKEVDVEALERQAREYARVNAAKAKEAGGASGEKRPREENGGAAEAARPAKAGTAISVDGPPLPEGWAAAKDAQGRTYFWHKATKKVQWDRPTAESVAA